MTRLRPVLAAALALAGCSQSAEEHAAPAAAASEAAAPAAAPAQPAAAAPASVAAEPAAAPAAGDATATASLEGRSFEAHPAEIGCGKCVFHMAGVDSCAAAVKVADQTVLLEGGGVDPHSLCDGTKPATVTGKVEGGKLLATTVTLVSQATN